MHRNRRVLSATLRITASVPFEFRAMCQKLGLDSPELKEDCVEVNVDDASSTTITNVTPHLVREIFGYDGLGELSVSGLKEKPGERS